jgi:hypothetical protein
MQPLSEESRAAFSAGNRFETTLLDASVRVWFGLFTGTAERLLPNSAAPNHLQKVTRCVTFFARFSNGASRHPT